MEEWVRFKREIVRENDGISRLEDGREVDLCYVAVLIVFWNHAPVYCYFLRRSVPTPSFQESAFYRAQAGLSTMAPNHHISNFRQKFATMVTAAYCKGKS